jgi:hypothetical protein
MGMHFGILCSDLPKDELLTRTRQIVGELVDRGPVADPNGFNPSPREGNAVIVGEREGKTYLMDSSLLISGGQPDLIVKLASGQTPALVVGCGAETVSGTFWLTAARGSDVIRSYFHSHSDLRQPFEQGQPLPSEGRQPLDGDDDGHGLTAALASFGFDFDSWFEHRPYQAFLYTGEGADPNAMDGPLGEAQNQHHARFKLPPGEQPTIKVVTRDRTGKVTGVSDTGIRLGDMGKRRESGASKFLKRLTGR